MRPRLAPNDFADAEYVELLEEHERADSLRARLAVPRRVPESHRALQVKFRDAPSAADRQAAEAVRQRATELRSMEAWQQRLDAE